MSTGQGDAYLRCIELHSHTLIQLEQWFTATGQTRVTLVGPLQARQWLVDMVWSLGSRDHFSRARGRCPSHLKFFLRVCMVLVVGLSLCLLCRHSYHLNNSAGPFCVGYYLDRVLLYS
jgi:hypothetical protein